MFIVIELSVAIFVQLIIKHCHIITLHLTSHYDKTAACRDMSFHYTMTDHDRSMSQNVIIQAHVSILIPMTKSHMQQLSHFGLRRLYYPLILYVMHCHSLYS
jgi:hypothetical protein